MNLIGHLGHHGHINVSGRYGLRGLMNVNKKHGHISVNVRRRLINVNELCGHINVNGHSERQRTSRALRTMRTFERKRIFRTSRTK